MAGHPGKIIFLTCDAYGVLPPVAKLTPEQAMYHFISGYTAKVAGTELGIKEPTATFSPCFGGPFLTLPPFVYANLLKEKMEKFSVSVYLVNTGWVGNSAQSGAKRFSLPKTRKILSAILNGTIENSKFNNDAYFGFKIPEQLDNLNPEVLNPIYAWRDTALYHTSAKMLVKNKKQINENIQIAKFKLIDARSLNRFKGIEKEPREGLRSGSIPNSFCLPFGNCINKETNEFLDILKLKEKF